jgi:hypothetical protein
MVCKAWWLADAAGARRKIDAGGALIGRASHCELVVPDPGTSRSQALVYLDQDGPRLVVLGRGRTLVGGERVGHEVGLAPGDRIEVPGASFVLEQSDDPDPVDGGRGWVIELPAGGYFGISGGAVRVGGHERDDLRLAGWPDGAFTLRTTQSRLHLLAHVPLVVSERPVDAGALVAVAAGDDVRIGDELLRVVGGGDFGAGSTVASRAGAVLPHGVRLEFLPRGGRLHLHIGGETRTVYLPGNRCDLMAALLQPPAPFRPGDLLDDELVLGRVWPNQARSRVDLNTLIYRLRRDLVAAGVDATQLVQRAAGGGATRIGLGDGAAITVS